MTARYNEVIKQRLAGKGWVAPGDVGILPGSMVQDLLGLCMAGVVERKPVAQKTGSHVRYLYRLKEDQTREQP